MQLQLQYPSYYSLPMIASENTPFVIIPQKTRQLVFDHLLDEGRLSLYLHRKLYAHAGLRSVDDLCQQYKSVSDFVARNKGAGKRTITELLSFLVELDADDTELNSQEKRNSNPVDYESFTYPPEVASISLELLNRQQLVSNILYNKLCRDA